MTPAEALEQVRALAETWRFKGKGAPDDMPDQFDEYADELAHEILAILDVVTPDAPATVEGTSDSPSHAWVAGRCPACGRRGLFVGSGGYLSCSQSGCPDPGAPHDALIPATPERTEQEREAADRAARGVVDILAMTTRFGADSIDVREVANMLLMLAEMPPTEQEREAAVERVVRALREFDDDDEWIDGIARTAIAAYEGREVSE